MRDIDNYTEEALTRSGKTIKNYDKHEKFGVIIIRYDLINRAEGAAIGATAASVAGWCGKLGLVLVSAAVPVSFPIVAGALVTTTLGAPVVGAVAGATIGRAHPQAHYFHAGSGELLGSNKNDAAEKLNDKADEYFREGDYSRASDNYSNAYMTCESGYKNEQQFKDNKGKAQSEIDAKDLNSEGNRLFSQGDYSGALGKYQEAYHKSGVSVNYNVYKTNKDKAQAEIDSIRLHSEGNRLFSQGDYSGALDKYQEAYDKSGVSVNYNVYKTNKDKAQAEIDSVRLNSEGNSLFSQGDYSGALDKYQEAYNKSKESKNYDVYKTNKDRSATIANKLSELESLWSEAWNAESADRSNEATNILQRLLRECNNILQQFPNISKFKQYQTLATLKLDGNDLFNQGLTSQQAGIELLQIARGLRQQQNHELANRKFREAKDKFTEALDKFTEGSRRDQRFLICVDLVQAQINEVLQSIEITESCTLNQSLNDLNLNIGNNASNNNNPSEPTARVSRDQNYQQQI